MRPRVAAVSYLNAKPLIEGLDSYADVELGVPASLLEKLQRDEVDAALCPVIDYFRSSGSDTPLRLLTSGGGIGCDGPTLTVRLFSRVPIEDVREVWADTESHTSVALLRVLLGEGVGVKPTPSRRGLPALPALPGAVLLIGDKVVTGAPPGDALAYEMDLGEAWREREGLPFVFATWMCRADANPRRLGDLAERLAEVRERNTPHDRRVELAERYHVEHGWPLDLATRYLTEILRYEVGPRELAGMQRFGALCGFDMPRSNL